MHCVLIFDDSECCSRRHIVKKSTSNSRNPPKDPFSSSVRIMDSSSGLSAETERGRVEFGTDSSVGGKPEQGTNEFMPVNPNPSFLSSPTLNTVVTALPQPMFPVAQRPQPTQQTIEYSLRMKPLPNTQIDFGEIMRQERVCEQHKLAASWAKTCKEVESETHRL